MEFSHAARAASAPRGLAFVGHWIERYRTYRLKRREATDLSRLPTHLLRDIGRDDLATYPVNGVDPGASVRLPDRTSTDYRPS